MRQIAVLALLVVAFVAVLVVAIAGEGGWPFALAAAWGVLVVRQVVVVWREARDRRATSEGVAGEG